MADTPSAQPTTPARDDRAERERLAEDALLAPCLIHEMRHPLMGAMAGLQFLEPVLPRTAAAREDYELVKNQLARLEELFRSYQDFFHPEQGERRPFPVLQVVTRAVELLGFRVRRLGARFSLDVPARLEASGTPGALLHALTNLLVNALDALEEAGGAGRLQVRARATAGGRVQVRVSDEGTGIPETAARSIFEPGFTTKPTGKGTGLGLPVARRMVGALGGSVELTRPGDPDRADWARTEFCVELPAAGAPAAPSAAPSAASSAASTASPPSAAAPQPARPAPSPAPASAGRVLAVDDEAIVVLLLRKALKQAGLEATVVGTAEEAEKLLQAQRYDLLITDKNLPGASGVDLARRARARAPGMGIILITGYASAGSASELLAVGIDDYVTKPFEIEALVARVSQVLEARRAPPPAAGAAGPRRLAVVERDVALRARIARELQGLGHTVTTSGDLLEALKATPDGLVAAVSLFTHDCRAELHRLRLRRPDLRVLAVGEPGSLTDNVGAIGLGARARLSRAMDDASLKAALAEAFPPGGAP